MCPSCGIELVPSGTRLHCKQCNGMLVTALEVEQMLKQLAPDQPRRLEKLLNVGGQDAPRKCPSCDRMMTVATLATVTVDQCPEHGIWFDGKELTRALEGQGKPTASPTLHTLYGLWQTSKSNA